MKKRCIFVGLGLAALIMAAGWALAGCAMDSGDDPDGGNNQETVRYTTHPVSSLVSSRAAVGEGKSYVLVNSVKSANNSTWYYLYYLGYVEDAPIAYKTAYYYGGTTPITITFEKSWVNEETITESTTKSKEKTTTLNTSVTATVGRKLGLSQTYMALPLK
jgi:hypothetical protein